MQTSNSSNTTAGGRVDDGQWHMITITSLEDGPGFQMFVDGAQAGILRTNATEQGAPCKICQFPLDGGPTRCINHEHVPGSTAVTQQSS